jgi:hypothetical protein
MDREDVELVRTDEPIHDAIGPMDDLAQVPSRQLGNDSGNRASRSVVATIRAITSAA